MVRLSVGWGWSVARGLRAVTTPLVSDTSRGMMWGSTKPTSVGQWL
jgi:hypothetical protein